jgi:site-specific recombinase XerD
MLIAICSSLTDIFKDKYLVQMYKTMFLLPFHAFLRIGEITNISSTHHNKNLIYLNQVNLDYKEDSVSIRFEHYKHKSSSLPFTINIEGQQGSYNIAKEVAKYLSMRGLQAGPLFIYRSSAITRSFFNNTFNQALKSAMLSSSQYKTHSFRIGAATHCLRKGYTMSQIQYMGRWKSSAFQNYLRVSSFNI